jgi:hypothetical protein
MEGTEGRIPFRDAHAPYRHVVDGSRCRAESG